jgi:hypothetical protein
MVKRDDDLPRSDRHLELTSLEIEFKESESEHQGTPKEEVAVKHIRALKKQHGDWNLA